MLGSDRMRTLVHMSELMRKVAKIQSDVDVNFCLG